MTFFSFNRYNVVIIENGMIFCVLNSKFTRKDIRFAPKYSTDENKFHRCTVFSYPRYGGAGPRIE
jgi:hypothetical protein